MSPLVVNEKAIVYEKEKKYIGINSQMSLYLH